MADFLSNVLPDGDALKRKIDSQRETFLKGVSSTKHGKKEDPTYLHFRFIFDFGDTSFLDPETFLAPSPLFRGNDKQNNGAIASFAGGQVGLDNDGRVSDSGEVTRLQQIDSENQGKFFSDVDFFYGSKFLLPNMLEKNHNINGGGIGYLSAQEFLGQRSSKRKEMLIAFKKGLSFINEKCPYYFQSVRGLDSLLKVDIKNLHKAGGKPQRMGTLTIDCLESIDMRMFSLSELYRKAIYDYTYHRVMLPENLRKFRMWLVISEIRNIQLSYGINDVLNPFSIQSVAQGANFLDSFNSQTGLLNNTEGLLSKSTSNPGDNLTPEDKFGSYTLGPYAFIYQFDQCEFDFDDSYPSFGTIDNKGGSAVNSTFKIHVGRVKDHKIQFNLLSDVLKKDDNIKSMVIADTWGSKNSEYTNYDYFDSAGISSVDLSTTPDPGAFFSQLASNFITNTVSDLKEQGVSIVQNALLGNIYGAGGVNVGSALRSGSSLVNTVQGFINDGVPNPFADNTPQARGLGGPGQRQYPTINEDVYPGVPGSSQQNLGTVYTDSEGNPVPLNEDAYPNVPGSSLGLPDREYPIPGGDEYLNVPGPDLGVPDRVYPIVQDDIYPTNPGPDGGLPDRQYPTISDDVYPDPTEVTTEEIGDVYSDDNIQYPTVEDNLYNPPAPVDTDNIGDVYPDEDNQYPDVEENVYDLPDTVETDNIGDIYPEEAPDYPEINDNQYEIPRENDTENIGDVYSEEENKYPGVSEKVYDNPESRIVNNLDTIYDKKSPEYPGVNDDLYKNSNVFTRGLNEDVYKTVPGSDLGVPGREYKSLNDDAYPDKNTTINTNNIGRVYPNTNNENN
jgi:hypothetical protein